MGSLFEPLAVCIVTGYVKLGEDLQVKGSLIRNLIYTAQGHSMSGLIELILIGTNSSESPNPAW